MPPLGTGTACEEDPGFTSFFLPLSGTLSRGAGRCVTLIPTTEISFRTISPSVTDRTPSDWQPKYLRLREVFTGASWYQQKELASQESGVLSERTPRLVARLKEVGEILLFSWKTTRLNSLSAF